MRFFISLHFIQNDSNEELKKSNTFLSLSNSPTPKPSSPQTLQRITRLNSLPLHHGTTINLPETADSGYESDAEIYL